MTTTTYDNIAKANDTATISTKIRLFETTKVIKAHYGQITSRTSTWDATAGWENINCTIGVDVLSCSPNCTEGNQPTNTLYTFTPMP